MSRKSIKEAIDLYFENLDQYDSLFSVNAIKKRVYNHEITPINHNNYVLEMTQNLPEILVENSNLFLFSRNSFLRNNNSRIGKRPIAFHMSEIEGIDIDYQEDFSLAELIYNHKEIFRLSD